MNKALARLVTQASTQIEDFLKKDVRTAQKTSPDFVTEFEKTIASITGNDPTLGREFNFHLDCYKLGVRQSKYVLNYSKDPKKSDRVFEEARDDLKHYILRIQSALGVTSVRPMPTTHFQTSTSIHF